MPSMRKSRLDKSKLNTLKAKNTEAQLTKDELISVGDEIVSSTLEGFNEELAKSPALTRIAEKNSELIKEFFIGYKEGVDSAIKEYIEGSTSTLEKTVETITKEKNVDTEIKEYIKGSTDTIEKAVETITKERIIDSKVAAGSVLQREKVFAQPQQSFAMKASDFGLSVLGEMFGLDKYTQTKLEERRQKEAFIQTESKLRPDVSRKQLAKDYKVIKEKEKELSTLQERSQILAKQGYSSEQIEKILDVTNKQNDIINTLMKVDPSRLGKFTAGTSEEVQTEQQQFAEKNLDEQENQTTLLQEIRDILKEPKPKDSQKPPAAQLVAPTGLPLPLPTTGPKSGPSRKAPPLARKAMDIGGTVFRKAKQAAPWVAATSGATNVITDIAQGKKIESLGDIVPEGWNVINPFDWAARTGAYVGEKINVGYGAASAALGGSGSLGGDIHSGVQGIKNVIGAAKPTVGPGRGVFIQDLSEFKTKEKQSQSVTITTPSQATSEYADVKFDPTTVGGMEYPEPPPPVEKKEPNMIPASEITDPEAAAFESAKQEAEYRAEQLKKPKGVSLIISDSPLSTATPLRFVVTAKKLPKSVETPRTNSATETAAEIGKNIVVNVPPPTVIPTPSQPTIVPTPFTNNVRNSSSSLNNYLYAY